jgi:long-chain-fatty-acid---luciferin-component ligase
MRSTAPPVEHKVLNLVPVIDRLVFGSADSCQDEEQLRFELVRESVERHIHGCELYARFAERVGFTPELLREPVDLVRVPQIPTLAFKRTTIVSGPQQDIAKRCTSSGTLGRTSVVHRDRTTIERLLGSVQRGLAPLGEWYDGEVGVLNLGPRQAEAGDLWFAYVMSLVELTYPTEHAVQAGRFDALRALERLRATALEYQQVAVIGPPALMLTLAQVASEDDRGLPPGDALTFITAGGWKRASGDAIDRVAFTDRLMDTFGLPGPERVRDAFNQVELNTVMIECSQRRKHVPPWLEVIVRDTHTLKPIEAGATGLLSYLDPSATSFPCFIIGDDLGSVRNGPCSCGWHGRTLSLERRVARPEDWGCALKMDQVYQHEEL